MEGLACSLGVLEALAANIQAVAVLAGFLYLLTTFIFMHAYGHSRLSGMMSLAHLSTAFSGADHCGTQSRTAR